MLTRLLLDPRDGRPRDPVFWLAAAAIASAQLLALYVLCSQQVRAGEAHRAAFAATQQTRTARCHEPTSADCAVFHGPAPVAFAVR